MNRLVKIRQADLVSIYNQANILSVSYSVSDIFIVWALLCFFVRISRNSSKLANMAPNLFCSPWMEACLQICFPVSTLAPFLCCHIQGSPESWDNQDNQDNQDPNHFASSCSWSPCHDSLIRLHLSSRVRIKVSPRGWNVGIKMKVLFDTNYYNFNRFIFLLFFDRPMPIKNVKHANPSDTEFMNINQYINL